MTQVTLPGTGGTVAFKYDPFGRRVQKAFTQNSTTTTTNYVYDGADTVEETDQNGNELAKYARTMNIDEPLAEFRSGLTSYYQADGLGSVTSLSNSAGALANTYTYDSFGNTTNSTGTLTNPFRYTGREFDTETSIFYYRARYYDPQSGRFTKEDPLQFGSGDPNFYDYVSNNPMNYTDPTGRFPIPGTNWCGPDWTGGLKEEYNPGHASQYKPPNNRHDTVCMHHDICHFNCRSAHPCDPSGRSNCFKTCDQIFVGEMPGWGPGPDLLVAGIYWHGKFGPNPGPNRPDLSPGGCGCGAK